MVYNYELLWSDREWCNFYLLITNMIKFVSDVNNYYVNELCTQTYLQFTLMFPPYYYDQYNKA